MKKCVSVLPKKNQKHTTKPTPKVKITPATGKK